MTNIRQRLTIIAVRYSLLIVFFGVFGAVGVPIVMQQWGVDLEMASTVVSVFAVSVVGTFYLLAIGALFLPTPTTEHEPIGPLKPRTKILVAIAVTGVVAAFFFLATGFAAVAYWRLGLSWALASALGWMQLLGGITIGAAVALPLTIVIYALLNTFPV